MRLSILTVALLFLGSLTGCGLTGSRCGTGGCSTGSCGAGGCGSGGCGSHLGRLLHSHGVCDCEYDDYCSSRSPWVRTSFSGGPAPAPFSEAIPAPAPMPAPVPAPAKLPDVKTKGL